MRLWKSSMFSNTTARPRCFMSFGVAAEGLMIAPPGHRLPRSTAMPVFFLNGLLNGVMTSVLWHGASFTFSQMVLPLTVKAFLSKRLFSPSSRNTAGNPPA
ncbi:hypothetical protein D3C83_10080 [compost metagenome]